MTASVCDDRINIPSIENINQHKSTVNTIWVVELFNESDRYPEISQFPYEDEADFFIEILLRRKAKMLIKKYTIVTERTLLSTHKTESSK
jgi:hypothetical protein